jgi:ABC-type transporter Mla MlaB component
MDASGVVALSGDLTFESVPGLYEQFIKLDMAEKPVNRIDLSAVQHADSAGLALLLEWKARFDQRPDVSGQDAESIFSIVNAPQGLIKLANLCNAVELLQMSESTVN